MPSGSVTSAVECFNAPFSSLQEVNRMNTACEVAAHSESLPTLSSSIVAVTYHRFPGGVVTHCLAITRALCNHQSDGHWLMAWQAGNLSGWPLRLNGNSVSNRTPCSPL